MLPTTDCTGCGACAHICPKNCISMLPDNYGFLYPQINHDICIKCGNRAMVGLCDDTVQGDMTRIEYFVPGTEPGGYCNCHVKHTVCKDSDMLPGLFCPSDSRETKVYLKTGTEDTKDESAVIPDESKEACTEHKNILDKFPVFGDDSPEEDPVEQDGQQEHEDSEKEPNWWENLFGNWH